VAIGYLRRAGVGHRVGGQGQAGQRRGLQISRP